MSPNTVTSYVTFRPGTKVKSSELNTNFLNHRGSLIPIHPNTTTAVDNTYSLGTNEWKWRKGFIQSGYFSCGDIKAHYSYNGRVSAGHGWMLCDGRLINETNYDAEYGSGSWDSYIVTSPLDGKYLPNLINRYMTGSDTCTANGSSTIASVGNSSSAADLSHTHVIAHAHRWATLSASFTTSVYTVSDGTNPIVYGVSLTGASTYWGACTAASSRQGILLKHGLAWTSKDNITTAAWSYGTTGGTILRPSSIEVQFYMRIIE